MTELPQHVGWLFHDWHLLPFYIHLQRGEDEGYKEFVIEPPPNVRAGVGRHYGFVVVELLEDSLDPTDACEFDFF